MRDIDRTKALPIKALKKYLKKVGLSKLEYISSYTARPKVLPVNSRAINHIAWGLACAKLRDKNGVKPKVRFAKAF